MKRLIATVLAATLVLGMVAGLSGCATPGATTSAAAMPAAATPGIATAAAARSKPGVVLQVSDADPRTWTQALNVVRNIQAEYGMDKVDIEVVVFGNGIGLLEKNSPQASRIAETLLSGAAVSMCENTMTGRKVTRADMLPDIGYVKAGVVEIIEKQKQGWAVVRP